MRSQRRYGSADSAMNGNQPQIQHHIGGRDDRQDNHLRGLVAPGDQGGQRRHTSIGKHSSHHQQCQNRSTRDELFAKDDLYHPVGKRNYTGADGRADKHDDANMPVIGGAFLVWVGCRRCKRRRKGSAHNLADKHRQNEQPSHPDINADLFR